eukprot:2890662-Rhodomonas_salina.3
MCVTKLRYAATDRQSGRHPPRTPRRLLPPFPSLLRACYAMSGTERSCTVLRYCVSCYAMSGTERAHGTTTRAR